ncbi:hypothetical protein FQR65_LT01449 [Abscondita terminalis]|nr:hypothetical protein FQR65_LT01449 [Abscondita terminalis]
MNCDTLYSIRVYLSVTELSEEQALKNAKEPEVEKNETPEPEKESMTFKLKYLGNTVVDKSVEENISRDAVKSIIKVAKAGKKIPRVNVSVTLKGVSVTDIKGNDMFEISIYKISNCSTDKSHRQIFSFITTDENETMECHAFLCPKRKIAEVLAVTLAQAFSNAYETWRLSPNGSDSKNDLQTENMKNALNTIKSNLIEDNFMDISKEEVAEEQLIDFDTELIPNVSCNSDIFKNDWVGFDDDTFNDDFQADFDNAAQNDFINDLFQKTQQTNIFCDSPFSNVNNNFQRFNAPISNNKIDFAAFS